MATQAFRPFLSRSFAQARTNGLRNARTPAQRRTYQSAAENPSNVVPPEAQESGFSKFWNSPIGPKTVHFWAPIMKVSIAVQYARRRMRSRRRRDRGAAIHLPTTSPTHPGEAAGRNVAKATRHESDVDSENTCANRYVCSGA